MFKRGDRVKYNSHGATVREYSVYRNEVRIEFDNTDLIPNIDGIKRS